MSEQKKIKEDANNASIGGVRFCPRCSLDTLNPKGSLDDDDKQAYFRSLLQGEPFTKSYKNVNIGLEVVFTELSNDDVSKIDNLISVLLSKDDDKNKFAKSLRMRVIAQISKLSIGENTLIENIYPISNKKSEEVLKEFDDKLGKLANTLVNGIQTIYVDFDRLLTDLSSEVLSEDFWKGAGRS